MEDQNDVFFHLFVLGFLLSRGLGGTSLFVCGKQGRQRRKQKKYTGHFCPVCQTTLLMPFVRHWLPVRLHVSCLCKVLQVPMAKLPTIARSLQVTCMFHVGILGRIWQKQMMKLLQNLLPTYRIRRASSHAVG